MYFVWAADVRRCELHVAGEPQADSGYDVHFFLVHGDSGHGSAVAMSKYLSVFVVEMELRFLDSLEDKMEMLG